MILTREAETGGIEPRPYARLPPPLRHTCGAMWASPPTNVLPKACALSMRRRAPQGYLSRFAPLRGHPPLHTSTGHIPHTQTKDRRMPVFCLLQIHFFIPPCRGPERQRHTARVDEHAQGCGKQKNRPPKRVVCLAGAERLELSTRGFGDRCSTN